MNSGAGKPPPITHQAATLHIEDLLANGQGVGRSDGLVTFVTGALPGEEVAIVVDARKANYLSAHATEILTPSPDRIESICPVFPRCGGCQALHFRYAAQLRWKQRMVADALERLAGFRDVEVRSTVASDFASPYRYRNKVGLVARVQGPDASLGFYAARSHRLVPIANCPVLLPWLDIAVGALIEFVRKNPGLLHDVRHIVLRTGLSRETLVMAISSARRRPELASFVEPLRNQIPSLTGLVASWDPPNENSLLGRRLAVLWGSSETSERVSGAAFRFGIDSFFQINTAVLEKIADEIFGRLADCRRLVDLYSGVGTFAVLAGMRGIAVTGVESNRRAVDEAAANAARNGVITAAFECADVEHAVQGERGATLLDGAGAVIVDPPRRGCEPGVLEALARAKTARIMYLSCNPATLARDARILVDGGYALRPVIPYDMFPFTGHVEVLAEFVAAKGAEASRTTSGP